MKCDTSRDEDFRASVGLLGLLLRDRGHLQGSNRYTWILMIAKSLQELDPRRCPPLLSNRSETVERALMNEE
jgi:hypothetical protein